MMVSVSATSTRTSRRAIAARIGLLLVAAGNLELGIWGIVAPHSLFRSYPGFGHHWVSALGPYNEHLLRDFAAASLGLSVMLVAAAIWFERRIVLIAGTAFLAATLPHFAYHVTTTESFSTADNTASLGAFVLEMVVVALAMLTAARGGADDPPDAV
jgi:hypothetical protein